MIKCDIQALSAKEITDIARKSLSDVSLTLSSQRKSGTAWVARNNSSGQKAPGAKTTRSDSRSRSLFAKAFNTVRKG